MLSIRGNCHAAEPIRLRTQTACLPGAAPIRTPERCRPRRLRPTSRVRHGASSPRSSPSRWGFVVARRRRDRRLQPEHRYFLRPAVPEPGRDVSTDEVSARHGPHPAGPEGHCRIPDRRDTFFQAGQYQVAVTWLTSSSRWSRTTSSREAGARCRAVQLWKTSSRPNSLTEVLKVDLTTSRRTMTSVSVISTRLRPISTACSANVGRGRTAGSRHGHRHVVQQHLDALRGAVASLSAIPRQRPPPAHRKCSSAAPSRPDRRS